MACTTPEMALARDAARFYRGKFGFNSLPSRTDVKRPALKGYTTYRDEGFPEELIDRFWSSNLQLALGCRWNLIVVDLDGPMALEVWDLLVASHGRCRTWAVRHNEAGGMHLWFSKPEGVDSLPFATTIWEMPNLKHTKIEVLGDRNLIVAPPSIHVDSGKRYKFVDGLGPDDIERPTTLPPWVVSLVNLAATRCRPEEVRPERRSADLLPITGRRRREDVLAAMSPEEKVAKAKEWGVRFAVNEANNSGWMCCHAIDREDRRPSASFHKDTGVYWEGGKTMTFFDIAVARGSFPTWQDCCDELGRLYRVPEIKSA